MNRPGILKTVFCKSRRQCRELYLAIVRRFDLGRRPVLDRLEDSSVVEPIDSVDCCVLHGFQNLPRAAGSNQLSLVQPDDGLGQAIRALRGGDSGRCVGAAMYEVGLEGPRRAWKGWTNAAPGETNGRRKLQRESPPGFLRRNVRGERTKTTSMA